MINVDPEKMWFSLMALVAIGLPMLAAYSSHSDLKKLCLDVLPLEEEILPRYKAAFGRSDAVQKAETAIYKSCSFV